MAFDDFDGQRRSVVTIDNVFEDFSGSDFDSSTLSDLHSVISGLLGKYGPDAIIHLLVVNDEIVAKIHHITQTPQSAMTDEEITAGVQGMEPDDWDSQLNSLKARTHKLVSR